MKAKVLIFTLVLAFGVLFSVSAQFDQAVQIIKDMEHQEVFKSAEVTGRMVINDRFGEKTSTFVSWSLGNDLSLIEFTSVEEQGQKILRDGEDLYLYYPEAEEEIRLSGSALRDGILGSDVSYEDMTGEKSLLDDYNITDFRSDTLAGKECWVIELEAKRPTVPYPKEIIWVNKATGNGMQTEKYSLSGRLLKVERVLEYRTQDGYTFPVDIRVEDKLKRDSYTEFEIDDVKIDVDIDENFFSRDNLTW